MAILEVLQQKSVAAYKFTVNNAVASVPLVAPIVPGVLSKFDGKDYLQNGDNFNLISFGINMPLSYELLEDTVFKNGIAVEFLGADRGGFPFDLKPGGVVLPFGKYELSINQFFDVSNISNDDYNIVFDIPNVAQVSMLNVPASENGNVYYVPIFAKIEHTLEMVV